MIETALAILQSVARRENRSISITTFTGVTDPAVLQLIEALYATCEDLRQRKCWVQQKRTHTFETEADRRLYPLPTDFYATLGGTAFDNDTDQELSGPLTDAETAYRLIRTDGLSPYGWRLFGPDILRTTAGQFQFDQTPEAGVDISFEYLMASFFIPADWDGDTDLRVTVSADTDLCIFDPDIVRLGVRAKWREDCGGDYAQARADFERAVDAAAARLTGPKVGSFAGKKNVVRYNLPYKSWSL